MLRTRAACSLKYLSFIGNSANSGIFSSKMKYTEVLSQFEFYAA
jgi:hypothetical protein